MAALGLAAFGCTPDLGRQEAPTAMQMDLTASPPRAPQPTSLIVNPQTGHIDFGLAGLAIPADCSAQQALSPAECEFDQYLQTLDGFPTVTTATAPASAPLDPGTLTVGQNVVVVAAKAGVPVTDVAVGFDATAQAITVVPLHGWTLGELYWVGVRGYGGGVRDAAGRAVVGSPTMGLLKQDTALTCGAATADTVDPRCPAFQVLSQGSTPMDAAAQLFQLEPIRLAYAAGFDLMAAAGLPKNEVAVLWGFPIQTSSVAVLAPTAGVVPQMLAPDRLAVGVQGEVDPATVSAFVVREQNGPVVVMDLTAANAGDLNAGFPRVSASYASGAIVVQAAAPFVVGHQIGVFFTNGLHAPSGAPLVASPVSVLLSLPAPLVDAAQHSTVSSVSDADAAALEVGRAALAPLFDNPIFTPLTGVSRANLVYCFAFTVAEAVQP